jgi:hypothetical protein
VGRFEGSTVFKRLVILRRDRADLRQTLTR